MNGMLSLFHWLQLATITIPIKHIFCYVIYKPFCEHFVTSSLTIPVFPEALSIYPLVYGTNEPQSLSTAVNKGASLCALMETQS